MINNQSQSHLVQSMITHTYKITLISNSEDRIKKVLRDYLR